MSKALICGLLLLYAASSINYISDANVSIILPDRPQQAQQLDCFLLSINHNHLTSLVSELNLFSYQQSVCKFYIGLLTQNKRLQQLLKIRRYPYAGIITNQRHPHGLPDILTADSLRLYLTKSKYYFSGQKIGSNTLIEQQKETIVLYSPDLHKHFGISRAQFRQSLLMDSIYYPLLFQVDQNLSADIVLINDEYIRVDSSAHLQAALAPYIIAQINEFSHSSFAVLTDHYDSLSGQDEPKYPFVTFMCILDSIHRRQQSYRYKKILEEVLRTMKFGMPIHIFWAEGDINLQKKQILGFKKTDNSPLLALFDPFSSHGHTHFKMDPSTQFNLENVGGYLASYFEHRRQLAQYEEVKELFSQSGIAEYPSTQVSNEWSMIWVTRTFDSAAVQNLKFIQDRINRFLFDRSVLLYFSPTLSFSNSAVSEGLYLQGMSGKIYQLSKDFTAVTSCLKDISKQVSAIPSLKLPREWCVPESEMQQFLGNGEQEMEGGRLQI